MGTRDMKNKLETHTYMLEFNKKSWYIEPKNSGKKVGELTWKLELRNDSLINSNGK